MSRWLAGPLALVSLVLPGLGHALAGVPRRALVIALVALVAQTVFLAVQGVDSLTPHTLALALLFLALCVAASLWVGFDTWRCARTASPGRWRQRLAVAALVLAPTLGLALLPADPITWRSFSTPSGSMIPTLRIGDRFIAQEGWYDTNPVRRGEVVVFTLPSGTAFVKRVIGVAGDRVQMRAGRLMLNGAEVSSTRPDPQGWREIWTLPDGPTFEVQRLPGLGPGDTSAEFHVPNGHVFVMGDNVENSADSRIDPRMRYVPVSALLGRAEIIFWPWTEGRFGRLVR